MLRGTFRCHVANTVTGFVGRWNWAVREHPTHSPDMNTCDYDLFQEVKGILRETCFRTTGTKSAQ